MSSDYIGKINNTSVNVLYTLMSLFEQSRTMNELIKILSSDGVLNNFVVSKYINTCRYCGIDIRKNNGKYELIKFPFQDDFNLSDEVLLKNMVSTVKSTDSRDLKKHISDFLFKLCRFTPFDINVSELQIYNSLISNFESALSSEMMINLILKNGNELICSPVEIKFSNNNVLFSVFNNSEIVDFPIKKVKSIQHYTRKIKTGLVSQTVTFKIMNDLAKRYSLRPDEKILNIESDNSLVISNRNEDKTELFRRLMRYDDNCVILSPQSYREQMKSIINSTIQNYKL